MHRTTRTPAERERLQEAARRCRDKRAWLRMRALLLHQEGQSVSEICRTLGISRQSFYQWQRRYQKRSDPADLLDRPKPGRPLTLSASDRAWLEALLEREPAALGYRTHGWTVPLLVQHLARERGVELSESTMRRTLRSLGYRWKRPRYVLARKDPQREEKKTGAARTHPLSAAEHGGALL